MNTSTLHPKTLTGACACTRTHVCAGEISTDTSRKIDQSIKLIKAYNKWKPLTLAYSGGKDSDVVRHLCKLAKVPITIVHNSTSIDYPGTLAYVQRNEAIIQRPKMTFFQLVAKKGLPSMFRRFCCSYLKEQYIARTLLLGVRADESVKRAARYIEPTACRIFTKKVSSEQVLPIIHWNNADLIAFHDNENLHFHPHYYVNGRFDVTRRVGCVGCPLQGDRGKADYIEYPKFLRQLCKSYAAYVETHKAVESVYHDIVWQLFYSNHHDKQYQQTYYGLFDAPNPKSFLEEYFNIELP